MKSKHRFYTKTLAELYVKQGCYRDAVTAYRWLHQHEPDRVEYRQGLESAENRYRELRESEIKALVSEWVGLVKKEAGQRG